jgi:hypothetical protein
MKPTAAVSNIVQSLDSRLSVPVRTSGLEGERPVPSVILDDWTITDLQHHNDHRVGGTLALDVDDDGATEYADWYHFYYDMRVELIARDADDVGAHTLLGEVQDALREFEAYPATIHDHVNTASTGTSGQLSYQFNEPKETEINQTFSLNSFHEIHVQPGEDVLESVQRTITTQNNS